MRAGRYIVAATLLLAVPLVAFLATNQYPLATPETGLLFAGCLAAGALLGFLSSRFTWLGVLILGGGTALCLNSLYGWPGSTGGLVLLLATCLVVAAALRRHLPAVLTAAGSVFIAATLLIPGSGAREDQPAAAGATARPQPAAAADLPVILHLVLDEHIGTDGLPPEVPGSAELARWLTESYVGQGFRLHPDAYSEYFETRNSLANLLNFSSGESDWAHLVRERHKPYVLAESAYFRHLGGLGYRLHVYESDYLDYCHVPGITYAGCAHYRANSIAALPAASLGIVDRARFIRNSVLGTSQYLQKLRDKYVRIRATLPRLALPAWDDGVSRVGPLPVLAVLRKLEADLRAARPGNAYFAHLLIPHFPYLLDAQCRVRKNIDEWLYNYDPTASELEPNSAAGRAARYEQYFAQIRCEQHLVNRLFEAMRQAGVWRTAIVIVHGDHGSRIVRRLPVQQTAASLTRSDLHDGFSTLFAAKLPGRAPGVVRDAKPLQALLADALGLAPVAGPAKVMLQDYEEHDWRPFPLSALRAQRAGD